MDVLTAVLGIAILAGIVALIYFTVGKKSAVQGNQSEVDFQKMKLELSELINRRVDELKTEEAKNRESELKSRMEYQEKTLTQMGEISKQMAEISTVQKNLESVSTNVVKLSDILSNNKTRGRFGEIQLEMLMGNTFGETNKGCLYDFQYTLEGDLRPDVAIFLDGNERRQTVCIDSKFSLAGTEDLFDHTKHLSEDEIAVMTKALEAALKDRIKETSKYIVYGKTIDYSVMFVPSDSIFIYADTNLRNIFEFAIEKHVVITCPSTLPAILNSFKVFQRDLQKTKNIQKTLDLLRKFEDNFGRLAERWGDVSKDITKLNKDKDALDTTVGKITGEFRQISEGKTKSIESFDTIDQ